MRLMRILTPVLMAFALVVGVGLYRPDTAGANDWCWDDPILLIDGKQLNVNVGVLANPTTARNSIDVAHTKVYLPQGVSYATLGFTNIYFRETVEFIPVTWLEYKPGRKVELEFHVSFKLKADAPVKVLDAQVDVTKGNFYRIAGNSGKTSTGVKVQYQLTN